MRHLLAAHPLSRPDLVGDVDDGSGDDELFKDGPLAEVIYRSRGIEGFPPSTTRTERSSAITLAEVIYRSRGISGSSIVTTERSLSPLAELLRTGSQGDLGGGPDASASRAVVDLLVEQVECADVILLNKVDLRCHNARGVFDRYS